MIDTTTAAEVGLFALVADAEREVEGLLLPYNELSRVSASRTPPIRFAPGTVAIPADPDVVGVNVEHDRFAPLGRAVELRDVPERGVFARIRIARTPEGDAYLANPSKRRLSPELAGIRRNGETGLTARLTGIGLVDEGAFESAALFALGEPETVEPTEPTTTAPDEAPTDPEPAVGEPVTEPEPEPELTTNPAPKEPTMPEAIAPAEHATEAQLDAAHQMGANAVFAAMVAVQRGDRDAETMLAALSDIKISGTGALPATGVLQPDWVGEVWRGRAYQRKYITLGTTGPIKALDAKGFTLNQGTALVTEWAGNKAPIGSGTASTSLVESILTRFAFAADIAREFFDLPGGEPVIAAFWRGVTESYARVSDFKALSQIVAAAGTPIAPDTYPTDYPSALGMLIQGIEAVEDAEDTPTFAIMNRAAWREALYAGHERIPEFVNFDFGTNGEGTADGFRVVRGDIGIADTPAVLVGSRHGIRFNELGETPVTFDALNVAKGGIDRGTVGYLQTMVERAASFVLVGTADVVTP